MVNKLTTGSILIGLSLTLTYCDQTSSEIFDLEEGELLAEKYEAEYNNPEKLQTNTIEEYFNEYYTKEITQEENQIYNSDIRFFGAMQEFANKQIDLDNDFIEALEELVAESINNEPQKKRF